MEASHAVAQLNAKRFVTDDDRAENRRSIDHLKDEITRLAGHLNAAKARLPAEAGALLIKALNAAVEELPVEDSPKQDPALARFTLPQARPDIRQRRADALALLAESFMKHGTEEMNGGDRNQIVVHVSAETLRDKTAGSCEIEHGPGVSAETCRRMACDSSVVPIIESENGDPLNVGRKTRTISAPLRRALNARDKGCRFPGCPNKRFIDGHHVKHWANGGETKLGNLVSLCRFHHHAVHEGGVHVVVLDDGAFRFVKPNGEALDSVAEGFTQPLSDWAELVENNTDQGVHIDTKTAVTRWCGEKMDYGLGIEVLLQKRRRAKRVSAETSESASR